MKTKRKKSTVYILRPLALTFVAISIIGAALTYRAMALNSTSQVSGVSTWTKNKVNLPVQKGSNDDIQFYQDSKSELDPDQPNTPGITPANPTPQPKAVGSRSPAKNITSNPSPSSPAPAGSDIAPESACPGEASVASAQTVLVCMTSYARNAHGIPGVTANSKLMNAAASKAQDIINCGFSHTACGHVFDFWFTVYGYSCGNRGENIAEGQNTPLEVFTAWMNSAGHRANILNPVYRDEGIAAANSTNGIVWVMELGGC